MPLSPVSTLEGSPGCRRAGVPVAALLIVVAEAWEIVPMSSVVTPRGSRGCRRCRCRCLCRFLAGRRADPWEIVPLSSVVTPEGSPGCRRCRCPCSGLAGLCW